MRVLIKLQLLGQTRFVVQADEYFDHMEPEIPVPRALPIESSIADAETLQLIIEAESELPDIKADFVSHYSGNPSDFGILQSSAVYQDEGLNNPDIEIWIQVLINEANNDNAAIVLSFQFLRDTCATRIESCYRGHLHRKHFLEVQKRWKEIHYEAMVKKLSRVFIGMIHRRRARKVRHEHELEFKGSAATVIQKIFRGFAQRLAWGRAMHKIDHEEHDFHLHRGGRERDRAQLKVGSDSGTSTSSDDDSDGVPYTNENWMPRHTPSMYRQSKIQHPPNSNSKDDELKRKK